MFMTVRTILPVITANNVLMYIASDFTTSFFIATILHYRYPRKRLIVLFYPHIHEVNRKIAKDFNLFFSEKNLKQKQENETRVYSTEKRKKKLLGINFFHQFT